MESMISSIDSGFDFSQIDVYQMEMFEVYSKTRNRSFRFARYNGNNYTRIGEYIHEVSPNTHIWPENELRVGTLYGYSGRTFKFEPIIEYNVRCIIASNPFLKRGDGYKDLSVSTRDIETYLKQSNRHMAFRYGDILATFRYDNQRECFILYDSNHKKGIECYELPANDEWYIGSNDGMINLSFTVEAKYQYSIHQVSIAPKISNLIDRIEKLKLSINRTCYHKGEAPIFAPSWEYYERMLCLSKECITSYEMAKFASCMYSILFEETKVKGVRRSTLGDMKDDVFVLSVGELRNYFSHGNAEYEPYKMGIQSVFKRYLHTNIGPQVPNDFVAIQMGVLEDFIVFLEKMDTEIRGSLTIDGPLMQDDNGHYYCGNAYIDPRFFKYKGCNIKSTQIITNTEDTADEYPYYCYGLDEVEVNRTEQIQIKNDVVYCESCTLPRSFSNMIGKNIFVKNIGVKLHKKDPDGLLINIKEWHPVPSVDYSKPNKLEKDSSGFYHIGNISIPPNLLPHETQVGDKIIIKNVVLNNNTSVNTKYPWCAERINNPSPSSIGGIKPTVNINESCRVERDQNGFFHIGNISVFPHKLCSGDMIKIKGVIPNNNHKTNKEYPLFAIGISKVDE